MPQSACTVDAAQSGVYAEARAKRRRHEPWCAACMRGAECATPRQSAYMQRCAYYAKEQVRVHVCRHALCRRTQHLPDMSREFRGRDTQRVCEAAMSARCAKKACAKSSAMRVCSVRARAYAYMALCAQRRRRRRCAHARGDAVGRVCRRQQRDALLRICEMRDARYRCRRRCRRAQRCHEAAAAATMGGRCARLRNTPRHANTSPGPPAARLSALR